MKTNTSLLVKESMSSCYVIDIGEIVLFKEKQQSNDIIGIVIGLDKKHKGNSNSGSIIIKGLYSNIIYNMNPDDIIDSSSYNDDDNDINDNINDDINDDEYDSYDINNIRINDNDMIIDDTNDTNDNNNNIIDILKAINRYRKHNNTMKMNKCISILLSLL